MSTRIFTIYFFLMLFVLGMPQRSTAAPQTYYEETVTLGQIPVFIGTGTFAGSPNTQGRIILSVSGRIEGLVTLNGAVIATPQTLKPGAVIERNFLLQGTNRISAVLAGKRGASIRAVVTIAPLAGQTIVAAAGGCITVDSPASAIYRSGICVPPGSLTQNTRIEIFKADGDLYPTGPSVTPAGSIVEFQPAGLSFDIPAEIRIAYDSTRLLPRNSGYSHALIFRLEEGGSSPEAVGIIGVDDAQHLLKATISSFTQFQAFQTLDAGPSLSCAPEAIDFGTVPLGETTGPVAWACENQTDTVLTVDMASVIQTGDFATISVDTAQIPANFPEVRPVAFFPDDRLIFLWSFTPITTDEQSVHLEFGYLESDEVTSLDVTGEGGLPPGPEISRFEATPGTIQTGDSVTLSWSSSHSTYCELSDGSQSELLPGGDSVTVRYPLMTTAYHLECGNDYGVTDSAELQVTVDPKVLITSFTVPSIPVTAGDPVELAWTTLNATACEIDQGIGTALVPTGDATVYPTVPTDYTLTCQGPNGPAVASVSVTPGEVTITAFYASPNPVNSGQGTTLYWISEFATGCELDGNSVDLNGSLQVSPESVGNHALVCSGYNGPTETTTEIYVNFLTATPSTIVLGESSTLEWATYGTISCNVPGIGSVPVSGMHTVSPAATTTYNLSCSGPFTPFPGLPSNLLLTTTVVVLPPPPEPVYIETFYAVPSSIRPGETARLWWTVYNAAQCEIDQGIGAVYSVPQGGGRSSGNILVSPLNTTEYLLRCSNEISYAETSAVVELPPPVSVEISADRMSIANGDSVHLMINTAFAGYCEISPSLSIIGDLIPYQPSQQFTEYITLSQPVSYTVSCTGTSGSTASDSISINVVDIPAEPVVWSEFINADVCNVSSLQDGSFVVFGGYYEISGNPVIFGRGTASELTLEGTSNTYKTFIARYDRFNNVSWVRTNDNIDGFAGCIPNSNYTIRDRNESSFIFEGAFQSHVTFGIGEATEIQLDNNNWSVPSEFFAVFSVSGELIEAGMHDIPLDTSNERNILLAALQNGDFSYQVLQKVGMPYPETPNYQDQKSYLRKIHRSGYIEWDKIISDADIYENIPYDSGIQISVDNNDNIFVSGSAKRSIDFQYGSSTSYKQFMRFGIGDPSERVVLPVTEYENQRRAFILKYNSQGVFEWVRISNPRSSPYLNSEEMGISYGVKHVLDFGSEDVMMLMRIDGPGIDLETGYGDYESYIPPDGIGSGSNAFAVGRYDSNGFLKWFNPTEARSLSQEGYDIGVSNICMTNSSGILISGFYQGLISFNINRPDAFDVSYDGGSTGFILELDQYGNYQWFRRIGTSGYDFLQASITIGESGFLGALQVNTSPIVFGPGPTNETISIDPSVQGSSSSGWGNLLFRSAGRLPANINIPPAFTNTPVRIATEGYYYSYVPEIDDDGDTVSFSIINKPAWLNFNVQTGALTGIPLEQDVGEFPGVIILVIDPEGNIDQMGPFTLRVKNENDPPVIMGNIPDLIYQDEYLDIIFDSYDSDAIHGEILRYSSENLPMWMNLDSISGVISSAPKNSDVGTWSGIIIKVTDPTGLVAAVGPFSITVINVNDPPIISGFPQIAAQWGNTYSFEPSWTDPDLSYGDSVKFVIANKPVWLDFDEATGSLNGIPPYGTTGIYAGITISAIDDDGATASLGPFSISISSINSAPFITGNPEISVESGNPYLFVPVAGDPDLIYGDSLTFSITSKPIWAAFDPATGVLSGTPRYPHVGNYAEISISVQDRMGAISALPEFSLTVTEGIPVDPEIVAPELARTTVTPMFEASHFLFTGDEHVREPVQRDTDIELIDPLRVIVLRGRVTERNDVPLVGVLVTIKDHLEYGHTLSREDGFYDLAINGGDNLTLQFEKPGYISAQRQLSSPSNPVDIGWQEFINVPELSLITHDPAVTTIDFTEPVATHRASVSTDANGTRQPTAMFFEGTSATMTLSDGTQQPLASINVRISEFTIGKSGLRTMPATLPATSAYTWAAEFSVDEAVEAGATKVVFSRPVSFYLDNFLNFPVGMPVPTGVYSKAISAWEAEPSGRVIRIVGMTSEGIAEIDTDGDNVAENSSDLSALGFSDIELEELATLYEVGKTLWRVQLSHFSWIDCNVRALTTTGGNGPSPGEPCGEGNPCCNGGGGGGGPGAGVGGGGSGLASCLIHNQRQSLGEQIGVLGTPYNLHYQTERMPGYAQARTAKIRLTGSTLPPDLQSVLFVVRVAGREETQSFAPEPDLFVNYTWDGKDVYGRTVQGAAPVQYLVGYSRTLDYLCADEFGSTTSTPPACPSGVIASNALQAYTQWYTMRGWLSNYDLQAQKFGGWSLSSNHYYDPVLGRIYRGDGIWQGGTATMISTVAGGGTAGQKSAWEGLPATSIRSDTFGVQSVLASADGGFYFTQDRGVYRVDRAGTVRGFAGKNCPGRGFSGDGGAAANACFDNPRKIESGPNGDFYIADTGNHRIRRIGPDGLVTTVMGSGAGTVCGSYSAAMEGTSALSIDICGPEDVSVSNDGVVYIPDKVRRRVWRVLTDGRIETFAGGGTVMDSLVPSWIKARDLAITAAPRNIDVSAAGDVYFNACANNTCVYQVRPDGMVRRIAGDLSTGGFTGDGGAATSAKFSNINGLAALSDGTLLVADTRRIRRVTPDGIVRTVAGSEAPQTEYGDGGPAEQAGLSFVNEISVAPDGRIFLADFQNGRVRMIGPSFERYSGNTVTQVSGEEMYVFDYVGRHLETRNTRTGTLLYSFGYDPDGLLVSATDRDGLTTYIERDGSGSVLAIVSPTGRRTELALWPTGGLKSVTNPAGERYSMEYGSGGLLTKYTNPRGAETAYTYDLDGLLIREETATGGGWILNRTDSAYGHTVTITSAEGRTGAYTSQRIGSGPAEMIDILPWGGIERRVFDRSRTTVIGPDGTESSSVLAGDPRFGMETPHAGTVTILMPSGLLETTTVEKSAMLSNPDDPLSLVNETTTVSVNGRATTSIYAAATRTETTTSPQGRVSTTVLDAKGRIISLQYGNLTPTTYVYDSRGRLEETAEGTGLDQRVTSYDYDNHDRLVMVTDPALRTKEFEYDDADRITKEILPDGREVVYGYDAMGNLTLVQPPGRPAHVFSFTPLDQTESYGPPDIGLPEERTLYEYNLDRDLMAVIRPDGQEITFTYNAGGQLVAQNTPHGSYGYSYYPTGQLLGISAPRTNGPGAESLVFTYDGGLLKSSAWSGTVNGTVSWTYDNSFRVTEEKVNGSNAVAFGYDNDDLLIQAGALSIARNPQNGLVTGTALGATATSHTYNTFGEPLVYEATYGGTTVFSQAYDRDSLGRIVTKTEEAGGISTRYDYTYDLAGRLTDVERNGVLASHYEYDANGNRLSRTDEFGNITAGFHDDQDRLLQYGSLTYDYTANGELARKTDNSTGDATTYDYDVLGNLRSVLLPDGTLIEYVIDGQNRRVGKKINGVLVQQFLYQDQLRIAAELNENGNIISHFVYMNGKNIPVYMVRNGIVYRIIVDHLGSPRHVIDVFTGNDIQQIDYSETGNIIMDTNPGFQPFGFAGGLYDRDTGLTRFGVRDYDPVTGRWASKDPIGFEGGDPNLYGYVASDPINFKDSGGKAKDPICMAECLDKEAECRKRFNFEKRIDKTVTRENHNANCYARRAICESKCTEQVTPAKACIAIAIGVAAALASMLAAPALSSP